MPAALEIKADSPDGYRALAGLTRAGLADHVLGEEVKLVASHMNGCSYCVAAHTEGARKAGVDEARIAATADWTASDLFDARERAAFALTDLLTDSQRLPHAPHDGARPIWDDAAAHFPGEELTRLVLTIVAINAWNRAMISEEAFAQG